MEFRDLGVKSYRDTWSLQQELLSGVVSAKQQRATIPAYILLVEHPPVYTLGRNGNKANLLVNTAQLKENDTEIIEVDRGGDITFHGYGQLVVYPIIDLDSFKLGLKDYVHKLEEVVINTIANFGIKGERVKSCTGVWLDKDTARERKICAIGVRCSHFVTMHGFALNVNTDLRYFNYINPCGFIDKGVTSIEKEIGKKLSLDDIKPIIAKEFKLAFNLKSADILPSL